MTSRFLLQLYVLQRYALEDGDSRNARTIQTQIVPLEEKRQSIRQWDTVGVASEEERRNCPATSEGSVAIDGDPMHDSAMAIIVI